MCCDRQYLRSHPWGFSCIHCGTYLDIGREPTAKEVELNCQPCAECATKQSPAHPGRRMR